VWSALLDELTSGEITPEHALAIIAHFQSHPGAWTPVALVARLRASHPDTTPDQLWMTPLPAWRDAEAIRSKVRPVAAEGTRPVAEWQIAAAIAGRLIEAGLEACITDTERHARRRFETSRELVA